MMIFCQFQDEKNWFVNQIVFAFNTSDVPQMGIAKSRQEILTS